MSTEYQEKIKRWVHCDNELISLRNQMRELRSERTELKDQIYTYAETNNLEHATIQLRDGNLKLQQIKQSSPLTFKFLKECLTNCLNSEESVNEIIKYIKERREVNTYYDIRRTFK
tara:strand:+ start:1732 stop:2079 length:348 start_codon:yes stop_codon:yes gene_type:complete